MHGFRNVRQLVDSQLDGNLHITSFRKVPAQASAAGSWFDLSMSPGNPVANYYASTPLVASVLDGNKGIFAGSNQSPANKHLARMCLSTGTAAAVPSVWRLLDYLLYYPFIDMDSTDEQPFDNFITLPRYTSGDGVKMMLVSQGAYTGLGQFAVSYTNQSGVAGRTTGTLLCDNTTFATAVITGRAAMGPACKGPLLPLQAGDTGVRSVESVTFSVPNGGIAALVLVKPLANLLLREITAPYEVEFIRDFAASPRIVDGAFLSLIGMSAGGSVAGATLTGYAEFTWR